MENQLIKTENSFPARFKQFLDQEGVNVNQLATKMCESGGVGEIKALGVKYGRWANGEVKPSTEALVDLAIRYNLDMNWLLLGEKPMRRTETVEPKVVPERKSTSPQTLPAVIDEEKVKAQAENAGLKKQVEILEIQNQNLWRLAFSPQLEKELGFLASGSHTTAADHMPISRRSIGFHNTENDETLDDILNEVKIIALDSSDCKVIQLNPEEGKRLA